MQRGTLGVPHRIARDIVPGWARDFASWANVLTTCRLGPASILPRYVPHVTAGCVDAGSHSFAYVAGWAKDKAVFRRNLHAIQQTANRLIAVIERDDPLTAERGADRPGSEEPGSPPGVPEAEPPIQGTAFTNLGLGLRPEVKLS